MLDGDSSTERPARSPGEPLRQRVREWLLLDGDRRVVAVVVAGLFATYFLALGSLDAVPLLDVQSLFYVFSALVGGNLTLITVVVSINQLLLSRELQTPGELRSQIDDVVDYRRDVEDATGEVAPVEPLGFLRLLVEGTREDVQRLGGLSYNGPRGDFEAEVDDAVGDLTDQMEEILVILDESDEDTIDVLSVVLETNYAREINRLRRLKHAYEDEIDEPVQDSIDAVIDRLQEIDVARQYFKSIYLQQELSSLSRMLLYVGLPAVAVALGALLHLTIPASDAAALSYPGVFLVASLTVGTLPLAILCSYILRTATVTHLTAATLPFTTPEQER